MKSYLLTLFIVAGLAVQGCQRGSDPTEKFDQLRNSVSPEEAEQIRAENAKKNLDPIIQEEKVVVPPDVPPPRPAPVKPEAPPEKDLRAIFHLTPQSALNFTEGELGKVDLKVRFDFAGLDQIGVELVDGPKGMSLKDSSTPESPNTWTLEWTPAYGTIPKGSFQVEKLVKFRLFADKIQDAKIKNIWPLLNKERDLTVSVKHSEKIPTVSVEDLKSKNLVEGEVTKFFIDVEDPLSYPGFEPNLDVFYSDLGKLETVCESNGSLYVRADKSKASPEHLGGQKWRFHYLFDARKVAAQLDAKCEKIIDSKDLTIRLSFKAYSSQRQTNSAEELVQTKVSYNYDAQPLILLMGEKNKAIQVEAGGWVRIHALLYAANLKGSVENISWSQNLPGQADFTCVDHSEGGVKLASQKVCTLNWNVPCDAQAQYTFEMQALHRMIDREKTSEFKRDLKVNLKSSFCQKAGVNP